MTTWERLAAMSPEEVKGKNLWPAGFVPLPHRHHEAGGTRFDLDFDLPQHPLPECPAPIQNIQRLFGSQCAMKSVEDFTEFEQRAAYFDGDPVPAQRGGCHTVEFFNLILGTRLSAQ
jgi:hypothetical protein